MRIIDTGIAIRIIFLLVKPIEETDAYRLGLIDKDGKTIKKAETPEENNATSMLHRLVWNLKRIIGMVPGGKTRIGSLAAAFLLMKEAVENEWSEEMLSEQTLLRFNSLCEDTESAVHAKVDELIEAILDELDEDAPANATGGGASTDTPNVKIGEIVKRKKTKAIDLGDATC